MSIILNDGQIVFMHLSAFQPGKKYVVKELLVPFSKIWKLKMKFSVGQDQNPLFLFKFLRECMEEC